MTITISSFGPNANSGPRRVDARHGETAADAATRFLVESWGYSPGFGWTEPDGDGARYMMRADTVYNNGRKGGSVWFLADAE